MSQVGTFKYNIEVHIAINTILFCMLQYTLFGMLEPDNVWSFNLSLVKICFTAQHSTKCYFFNPAFYGV